MLSRCSQLAADVAVVGGGPAGLLLASLLAESGFKAVVLEEHRVVGEPPHCAGLVTPRCLRWALGLPLSGEYVQNAVRGARVYSPSGATEATVERPSVQAVVVDRPLLDRALLGVALSSGAEVLLRHRVRAIRRAGNQWLVDAGDVAVRSPVVVDAAGPRFLLARAVGARPPRMLRGALPAVQVELEGVRGMDPDFVEIYLGSRWAPGFFAWLIPTGDREARIGLAASRKPVLPLLKHLLARHPRLRSRVAGARERRLLAGVVLVSGPLSRTWGNGALLVGDAGGFTKPTTGGGLFVGAISSRAAARAIELAWSRGDLSSKSLSLYESLWRAAVGRELAKMRLARAVLRCLPDPVVEEAIGVLRSRPVRELLESSSDVDYQLSGVRAAAVARALALSLLT